MAMRHQVGAGLDGIEQAVCARRIVGMEVAILALARAATGFETDAIEQSLVD
jgi:hypothetical protein